MATTASPSPQARIIFQDKFKRLEETVNFDDKREFQLTTLQDVREAARQIERGLGDRGCLRNMKRLQPFLNGLDRYSTIIEILCNGTPYLPYIWAPVKLMLKLASDFQSPFDKLIGIYARIAENLPYFDRLNVTFQGTSNFQQVLAMVYSDILGFHRHTYKFFRRTRILEDLAVHSDLVGKEANALHISQAAEMRSQTAKQISDCESIEIPSKCRLLDHKEFENEGPAERPTVYRDFLPLQSLQYVSQRSGPDTQITRITNGTTESRPYLIDFATNPLGLGSSCKILIASCDVTMISRFLSQRMVLSLGDDLQAFQAVVQPYVYYEFSQLRNSLSDIEVEESTMDIIERRLVEKANGDTHYFTVSTEFGTDYIKECFYGFGFLLPLWRLHTPYRICSKSLKYFRMG
ncbi:hypothetical protein G7Y89_g3030 [Cudoniella acicularis]|uniref:DUF7708 domain-containing protein n=1 Tax=Cudoniella acicularis TaxID=354080 RepID=A0A8H4RS70_9HELO|nr:hypothetical protein G7Y89_g3030 [Cudoniella acicularis]